MNERKILAKIESLMKEQTALYAKYNKLWTDKPLGYKLRAAVVKNQIHNVAGEIAAWKAKLTTR